MKIYEILPIGGFFLSITFAQPHFRLPFFIRPGLDWSVRWVPVRSKTSEFDYFAYIATKESDTNYSDNGKLSEKIDKFLKRPSRSNGAESMRMALDNDDQYLTGISDALFT